LISNQLVPSNYTNLQSFLLPVRELSASVAPVVATIYASAQSRPARAVSDQAPCEDRRPMMIAPHQEPGEMGLRGAPPKPLTHRNAYHLTISPLVHRKRALIAPSARVQRPSIRLRSAGASTPP